MGRGRVERRRNVALLTLLSLSSSLVTAQSSCISLQNSSACPAFKTASISRDDLKKEFPFLEYVKDTSSFDDALSNYVKTTFVHDKYQNLFGCGEIDLTNTTTWYARFTTTVMCNALVQKSINACSLSKDQSRSICADGCAEFAQSEAYLTSDRELCANPKANLDSLIRADFTTCSEPLTALAGRTCINPSDNEKENCGFGTSTIGLCAYCSDTSVNSTDTCCYNSNTEQRCQGIKLPVISTTMSFDTPTGTASPSSTADPSGSGQGGSSLSGGAIAGIVVGAIAGLALLGVVLFFCIRRMKRSKGSQSGSIFNQPSPARKGPPSMTHVAQEAPQGYEVLPGGRIARMSALEGHSGDSSSQHHSKSMSATGGSMAAGYAGGRRKDSQTQSSSEFGDDSEPRMSVLRPPPSTTRRNGSLSSNSIFGTSVPQSPTSAGAASPLGVGSQQSEQLPYFKDYYSQDDIHPGDSVAVLWAYQPRATDEFALERGDMLKVVGIWDDGWATGVMIGERAEEWEARREAQRDSGVSHASGRRDSSAATSGEIKAFPLVCVCLPAHWRKTIEGDGSTETGSTSHNPYAALA
ncbi:unnamed protein product [Clonostachys rhizophaga]|uniref:SH3 domain-containing protein n=1 Tax=Clonostachys rhizophaga TaxID=160324 RepID=A0A9N9YBX7_9HYPO|nr:unnamed protein product [Clonostachys rhizophaga]